MAKEKKSKEEKTEKDNVPDTMAAIAKKYGKGAIMLAGSNPVIECDVIKTGSLALDKALGVWGIPRGRVIEVYGPESSGKTTLALSIVKECQKAGGVAAYIDAEHCLDLAWAKAIGVNIDTLMLSQPDSGEEALGIVEMLALSKQVQFIVVDSVAALIPQAEIDGDIGDSHIGAQARLMSQSMRKFVSIVNKTNCSVLFINQIRMKIGVMFGNPETTPGGHALKFYASVRLDIRKIAAITENETNVGNRVRVKVIKNKVAPPFRIAEFDIYFGKDGYPSGIDYYSTLLDIALEVGVAEKSGSWINYGETRLGLGKAKAADLLRNNAQLADEIEAKVKLIYQDKPVVESNSGFDDESVIEEGDE